MPDSLPLIAIIGTAGRGGAYDPHSDYSKLARKGARAYVEMLDTARTLLTAIAPSGYRLISGGAAWADHLAVSLYLEHKEGACHGLTLHLPCPWAKTRFHDTGVYNFRTNPGGTSNALHAAFSRIIGRNSLAEIDQALNLGAQTAIGDGFFDRNNVIAQNADHVIAFTFGRGAALKHGGTHHTMEAFLKRRDVGQNSHHVNLTDGKVYSPALL